jgi:hypothetical protein
LISAQWQSAPMPGGEVVMTDYRKLFDLSGKTAVVLGAAA